MDDVVCGTCGSGFYHRLIAKCVRCSIYQHRYCMPEVQFTISSEWVCSECQEQASGDPRPNQGGQSELQSANGVTRETESPEPDHSHSKVVRHINPNNRKISSSAKVKFISSEEVASLNRDKRPHAKSNPAKRQRQFCPMSPPSLEQNYLTKCTSLTRSDTQLLALHQGTASGHDHKKIENRSDIGKGQVRPASPPISKQSSNMKCVSPSRGSTQVQSTLKRCVPVIHDKANTENRSEFVSQKSQVLHATPRNVEQSSYRNSGSPSRSDMEMHALKRRCTTASHDHKKIENSSDIGKGQVCPASPPILKQSSNMECVSPRRSVTQVQPPLKQCVPVSHDKANTENRSEFVRQKSQFPHATPRDVEQTSNRNSVFPSRSVMEVHAQKRRCTTASHDHKKIENRSDLGKGQVHPASPPILKQSSNMECVSPGRSGTQVQSPLKRCVPVSHDKANTENRSEFVNWKSQSPHATPRDVEQPSNRNSVFPSRSVMEVHAQKQYIVASREARKKDLSMSWNDGEGSSMPMTNRYRTDAVVKGKVDTQVEDESKEKKLVSADEEEVTSLIQLGHRDKEALRTSVSEPQYRHTTDHEFKWDESRCPSSTNCWKGCFLVLADGERHYLGEFKAYFSARVSRKVPDVVNAMPTNLQLEMLHRMDEEPKLFQNRRPTHEDIGLYIFPNKIDGHEKKHSDLLGTSCNYVMRAHIDRVKLLIYSSEVLPPDSQWVDGKSYLWGVFVRIKNKRTHRHICSTTT